MTTPHSPPVPNPPAAEPSGAPLPATDVTRAMPLPADEALRVSSLELQTGLQVSDADDSLTPEDFNTLFGGSE